MNVGDIVILLAIDDNELKVGTEGLESWVVEDGVWGIKNLPGGEEEGCIKGARREVLLG